MTTLINIYPPYSAYISDFDFTTAVNADQWVQDDYYAGNLGSEFSDVNGIPYPIYYDDNRDTSSIYVPEFDFNSEYLLSGHLSSLTTEAKEILKEKYLAGTLRDSTASFYNLPAYVSTDTTPSVNIGTIFHSLKVNSAPIDDNDIVRLIELASQKAELLAEISTLQATASTATDQLSTELAAEIDRAKTAEIENSAKIDEKIAQLINQAPEALNTLNELAAALGDDENFGATITSQLTVVSTAINTERERAKTAESAEEVRALAAEASLATTIDAEKLRAQAAENAEEVRALAAEASLATTIEAEKSRAEAAEKNLEDNKLNKNDGIATGLHTFDQIVVQGQDKTYLTFGKWRLAGSIDGSSLLFQYESSPGQWVTGVPFIFNNL